MHRPVDPPPHLHSAYQAFAETLARCPDADFLCIPARAERDYCPDGESFSYARMAGMAAEIRALLERSGFGHGHRIAVMLGNRPEHFQLFLAANAIGAMIVPLGFDQTADEIAHVLDDSAVDLILSVPSQRERTEDALGKIAGTPQHCDISALPDRFAPPRNPGLAATPGRATDALLLYTSGTTGLPKGCRVTNDYFLHGGQWYISRGGRMTVRNDRERIFNPFPMLHMNAGVLSLMAMILTGGCVISAERFHPASWWDDIAATRATIMHYMGVIPPILLAAEPNAAEKRHHLRFAFGAGVAPATHIAFEKRFGFPMVEVWGMTETGRTFTDHLEPRSIHTRAIGRPLPGLEARVVDSDDREVPRGTIGELTVRHTADDPRKGFFGGYLNRPDATEEAWRGGWFHTGDVVRQDEDGLLTFVDRTKNIIRRSGENISASEVEAALASHPDVVACAVLAVPDDLREEEVLACIVPTAGARQDATAAEALVRHCRERLSYFKVPGWLLFRETLPTTGTSKVQHRLIFAAGEDPRTVAGCHDLRPLKAALRKSGYADDAKGASV
ncbi:putative acyl-CoA ligase [Caenibius tardaugens NBRC 16725]|uniref:Putative acyl-CoA ligase n=1 Tax=Caenibius tardaugens NBRC 16725 TaxID=1219035 RepID=U2Y417_9SPHN|nr:AMP-binding protein [Caenibius tardaugens]AZI37004.1 long-chain fatty acid--CoA ligase [Caenibius tardaugens NBRC 16725]GAD47776.1 putative acyl-CoA ligase [Caenibius tardaugens NBRC 16725]